MTDSERPPCPECDDLREQLVEARRSRRGKLSRDSIVTAVGGALGALIAELLRQKGLWH